MKFFLLLPFVTVSLVVVLDQIAKYFVSTSLPLYGLIDIIPNVMNIVHVRNPGGAFGFMSQSSYEIRNIIFLGVPCFAIITIILCFKKISQHYKFLSFGLSLILGGTIGNVMDRLRFGEVIDFVDIVICSYHWPAFNIADSAITAGIIISILYTIIYRAKNQN